MRYRVERTLPTGGGRDNRRRAPVPAWVVMTDDQRLPDARALVACLPPGSAVVVRGRDAATLQQTARDLLDVCRRHDVRLLLSAERPPRRLVGDGLHIPERGLAHWRRADVARLAPRLLSAAVHGRVAMVRAGKLGVDAVLLSPVFTTKSHAGVRPLGLYRFAALTQHAPAAVIALGGIGFRDVRRVLLAGAWGVAGIGLFAEPDETR